MTHQAEIVENLSSEDPLVGLQAAASLRALLESVEELHVQRARARGWSWQQIATALGVTRQAAHQKWARTAPGTRGRRR